MPGSTSRITFLAIASSYLELARDITTLPRILRPLHKECKRCVTSVLGDLKS
jgi:hypothetical protein